MPRIDPLKLLSCLKILLAPNGAIRSEAEVKRLAGLMTKYSKKLVSKCIYIQILKCTDTELLGLFMGLGGWSLTHLWLNDGIRAENWPLVQEILELLLLCPVDMERLRSNTSPKLVKILSKDGGNEGVRILATRLVEQWLKVVKGETKEEMNNQPEEITAVPAANRIPNNIRSQNNDIISNSMMVTNVTEPATGTLGNLSKPIEFNVSLEDRKTCEPALVYRLIVKDGKQILSKVENPPKKIISIDNERVKNDTISSIDIENNVNNKIETKENEKDENNTESEIKDSKERSKSIKDKDKHKSSSSNHKSSSSKSSSSSSSSSSKNGSSSSSRRSKSSSSHRSSSDGKIRDKDSDKEKHRSSSSSKDKHKDRDKEKSSNKDREKERRDSKSKDREKEKSKEKEKIEQSEKDKDTLSKITPSSLDKLGKIPKKPKDDKSSGPTSITIPSKKASMSIEIRKDTERPKTVKTYNSQFRSHGLTDEAPPPPSRKGLKKPTAQSIPGTAIPSNLSLKRLSPPPNSMSGKDIPAEKKAKIDMNATPNGSIEKPGAIKLIAPKPKPSTLIESDMFMDALSASAYMKKDTKKRKRRTSTSKDTPTKEGTSTSPPESPAGAEKVAPLKFYQDTLDDNKEEDRSSNEDKDKYSKDNDKEDEDDIPLKRVKEAIELKVQNEKDEEDKLKEDETEEYEEPVKKPPGPGCGPDGPPGVLMLHRRKGPKKVLKWKTAEELEEIRYFELDETERVNVTKTFVDMKHMERMNEREAFLLARKLNCEDTMTEQTMWLPLILVDEVPPHPEGNLSREKKIQAEREQTTLKALYFNRHMIPDSPSEPDMEQYQITEASVIPLEDITGNPDAVNDFTNMPWPESKGSPPPSDGNFPGGANIPFQQNQFNPYMQFGQPQWSMQRGVPGATGPRNGLMPTPMMPPMVGFNNVNNMNMNMSPNMMMGPPKPDDMPPMNMGIIPPFRPPGPGGNFGGPQNGPFNNFGPPPNNMNMNPGNFNPPNLDHMMNRGPRGIGPNNRGIWRPGGPGPLNQSGGSWRPQGPAGVNTGNANWVQGNRRICNLFQRGHCRNGNKCNFLHPAKNNPHRI